MKKSDEANYGPKISEPTDNEINKTFEEAKRKYEIFIQRDDAVKYWKLKEELGWWIIVEKSSKTPGAITKEMTKEIQEFSKKNYGNDVTLTEAARQAKESVVHIVPIEKERIADKIRAIIAKYK